MNVEVKIQEKPSLQARLAAAGPIVVAFLASQHHLLHMLILLLTFGSAGMSVMSEPPLLRWGMILMSLVMVGITLWQMWRWKRNRSMMVLGGISVILTLGLVLWSIAQGGL